MGALACSATSAANLVELLTPDPVAETDATEIDGKLIGAAGLALLALVASHLMGGSAPSPAPTSITRSAPQIRAEPTKKAAQQETSFSLLEQYLKN